MARKVVNRKQLREEAEAAEAAEKSGATKKKTAKTKKKAAKRKTRSSKAARDARIKLYWGVFSQSLKRVALYEYSQRKQAEKKAQELSASGKSPHFVQKVKEEIVE